MFCGSRADDKSRMLSVLDPLQRITCQQYKTVVDSDCAHLLIDVREPVQYEICHLDNSTSKYISQYSIILYVHSHDVIVMWVTSSHYALQIYLCLSWKILRQLSQHQTDYSNVLMGSLQRTQKVCYLRTCVHQWRFHSPTCTGPLPIYVVCHHGNDSQKAVQLLQKQFSHASVSIVIRDIINGLSEWSRSVDTSFPDY